ncbi:MAG TPA: hypothetical protein HPQ03_07845 [Deltaproteobacteria bacterium]|nr:hypothetical protein [Deltaproteobacteria bacterium]
MNDKILFYLVAAIFGVAGGFIGSLIAPWVHWGVEKRRQRQARRRELIRSCRSMLSTEIDKKTFRDTEVYSQLRPHLYKVVIDELERDESAETLKENAGRIEDFKQSLLEDIARIESEWILI